MRKLFNNAVTTLAFALAVNLVQIPDAAAAGGITSSTTSSKPALSLTADRYRVVAGRTAVLTWNSTNASKCTASGAWTGLRNQDGAFRTPPLQTSSTFTLTCKSALGPLERSVVIDVTKPATTTTVQTTPVKPTLQLTASASAVTKGSQVTLSWSGQSVSNCRATGSWSGPRTTSGIEVRASITASQNFTLTCDSTSGTVIAMTSVQVWSGGTQVSWVPPQQNVDGSPLNDLAAYRIYVGTLSRSYDQRFEVKTVSARGYYLDLPPGEYYVAMTAVDTQGNESKKSNEVLKVVQ